MSQVPKPQFFYLLRTQYENLGDLIINRGCSDILRERGTLTVNVAGVPLAFIEGMRLRADEIQADGAAFYKALSAAARSGAPTFLVLVPGASLGGFSLAQAVRQAGLVAAYGIFRARGIHIIRLGASIGPYSGLRASIERAKSKMMAFIGCRDSLSLDYANRIGFDHLGRFPDMAYLLPTVAPAADSAAAETPYYVLSFRTHGGMTAENLAERLKPLIDRLDPERRYRLVFSAQVERDLSVARAIADRFETRRTDVFDGTTNETALMSLYGGSMGVFSNRLHVLLFALSRSASIMALVDRSHDRKIIGLFRDSGLVDRLVDINEPAEMAQAPLLSGEIALDLFSRMRREAAGTLDRVIVQASTRGGHFA